MTIASLTNTVSYSGDGTVATYSYPFRIFSKADLYVATRTAAGVQTVLVVDVDYTVTGVKAAAGGTIVLSAGNLANGTALLIKRQPAILQGRDFKNQGSYYAVDAEDAWDFITMIAQSLTEQIDRAYKVDVFTTPPTQQNGAIDLVTVAAETAARIAADAAEAAARAAADAVLAVDSWGGMLEAPTVKTYVIELSAVKAGTINSLVIQLVSGTLTCSVQIDGVAVTGLATLSCDSTKRTFTATALNTYAIGAKIALVVTAVSSPVDCAMTLKRTKTLP